MERDKLWWRIWTIEGIKQTKTEVKLNTIFWQQLTIDNSIDTHIHTHTYTHTHTYIPTVYQGLHSSFRLIISYSYSFHFIVYISTQRNSQINYIILILQLAEQSIYIRSTVLLDMIHTMWGHQSNWSSISPKPIELRHIMRNQNHKCTVSHQHTQERS